MTPRYTDDDLRGALREFADERGECPTYTAVADVEDMATPQTYENRFGSWTAALDTAGLPTFDVPDEQRD